MSQQQFAPLERLSELAALLRGADLRGMSQSKLDELLQLILAGYEIQVTRYNHRQLCFRARLCRNGKPYPTLHDMLNPPGEMSSFGRANTPGSPVVYSSWNIPTALDEIGAKSGDVVQVIGFNVVPGLELPMAIIGDLQRRYGSGRALFPDGAGETSLRKMLTKDPDAFVRCLYIDSLLSEIFSSVSDKHYQYRVSANVAESLYRQGLAVLFPSVRLPHAMNLAYPRNLFDSHCQVLFAEMIQVEQFLGYGIYTLQVLASSSTFARDGSISWGDMNLPIPEIGSFGGPEPPGEVFGWRPGRLT